VAGGFSAANPNNNMMSYCTAAGATTGQVTLNK